MSRTARMAHAQTARGRSESNASSHAFSKNSALLDADSGPLSYRHELKVLDRIASGDIQDESALAPGKAPFLERACKNVGIDIDELMYWPMEEFKIKGVPLKVQAMRYEAKELDRLSLVNKIRQTMKNYKEEIERFPNSGVVTRRLGAQTARAGNNGTQIARTRTLQDKFDANVIGGGKTDVVVGKFDAQALSEQWMEKFSIAMEQTLIKHDEEVNALAIAQVRKDKVNAKLLKNKLIRIRKFEQERKQRAIHAAEQDRIRRQKYEKVLTNDEKDRQHFQTLVIKKQRRTLRHIEQTQEAIAAKTQKSRRQRIDRSEEARLKQKQFEEKLRLQEQRMIAAEQRLEQERLAKVARLAKLTEERSKKHQERLDEIHWAQIEAIRAKEDKYHVKMARQAEALQREKEKQEKNVQDRKRATERRFERFRENRFELQQKDREWTKTIEARTVVKQEAAGSEAERFKREKMEIMKIQFEKERLKEEAVQRNIARVRRLERFKREEWENKILMDMQKAYRVEAARELVHEAKKQHDIETFRKAAAFRKQFAKLSTHGKLDDVIKLAAQLRTKEEEEALEPSPPANKGQAGATTSLNNTQ